MRPRSSCHAGRPGRSRVPVRPLRAGARRPRPRGRPKWRRCPRARRCGRVEDVVQLHVVLDSGDRGRRHEAQLDVHLRRLGPQQPAQPGHRGAGALQLGFQPSRVVGDQRPAWPPWELERCAGAKEWEEAGRAKQLHAAGKEILVGTEDALPTRLLTAHGSVPRWPTSDGTMRPWPRHSCLPGGAAPRSSSVAGECWARPRSGCSRRCSSTGSTRT